MDGRGVGRGLYNKIVCLFSDFEPDLSEGDEENTTIVFFDLVQYLEQRSATPDSFDLLTKIDHLRDWVEEQPRGESAADDILTSYFVSFVEKVLRHHELYRIAPWVVSIETLTEGKDYFYYWVGPTEYHRALSTFPEVDEGRK